MFMSTLLWRGSKSQIFGVTEESKSKEWDMKGREWWMMMCLMLLTESALFQGDGEEEAKGGLSSRGLCLIPVESTLHVASTNGADFWSPAMTNHHHSSSTRHWTPTPTPPKQKAARHIIRWHMKWMNVKKPFTKCLLLWGRKKIPLCMYDTFWTSIYSMWKVERLGRQSWRQGKEGDFFTRVFIRVVDGVPWKYTKGFCLKLCIHHIFWLI